MYSAPYLIVHTDGSITLLESVEHWSDDPDMYLWMEKGEYIVDSEGRVLEATANPRNRADFDETWTHRGKVLKNQEWIELGLNHARAEGLPGSAFSESSSIKDLIEQLTEKK